MVIRLHHNDLEAGIDPNGACLVFFRSGQKDILRPRKDGVDDALLASCFPCLPYFGRIPKGFVYQGKIYPLTQTHMLCDPENAIHGEAWVQPWQIIHANDQDILLQYESETPKQRQFPFPWRAQLQARLDADGLYLKLAILNKTLHPAPFGLGLHPFFPRTPSTRLEFHHSGIFTPPGMPPLDMVQINFNQSVALPAQTLDYSFTGFGGTVKIQDTLSNQIIYLITDAPHLHLYAPAGQSYYCLEPITQLPGQFNQDAHIDELVLQSSETKTLSMTLLTGN